MKKQILSLSETSILVAMAVVLELIKKSLGFLNFLPYGGSIWFTMLPLIVIGIRRGLGWGIAGGITFAIVNYILDGYSFHWGTFIFDYLLAFGSLGLSGLAHKHKENMVCFILAFVGVGLLRWVMHGLSGVFFFAEDMPEKYQDHVWFYSFIVYNLSLYMGPSIILTTALGVLLRKYIINENLY
jgi:thiamine transporter